MISNVFSAFRSIWGNKLRSLLTLLGVVIGVTSVTTLIALGQGMKQEVSDLIQGFGTNVIVVMNGKIDVSGGSQVNPGDFLSGTILTTEDVATIRNTANVEQVSAMSLISGTTRFGDQASGSIIFGTDPNILQTIDIFTLAEGNLFPAGSADNVIVLNHLAREKFFGTGTAIGQVITIGKDNFTVVGVLSKPKTTSAISSEYDNMAFIPFATAKAINKGETKINRIIVKAGDTSNVKTVKAAIHDALFKNHGEENFSVLTQDDILSLFDKFLTIATSLVSAIAAISLLVGGIGIMNIMLVTVTERTKEIGIRKAVGATRRAILTQFLTEALVITLLGGMIGLGLSLVIGQIVESQSVLHPDFSFRVFFLTVGISVVVGIIFGIWPAMRAAYKDPIEALRYE